MRAGQLQQRRLHPRRRHQLGRHLDRAGHDRPAEPLPERGHVRPRRRHELDHLPGLQRLQPPLHRGPGAGVRHVFKGVRHQGAGGAVSVAWTDISAACPTCRRPTWCGSATSSSSAPTYGVIVADAATPDRPWTRVGSCPASAGSSLPLTTVFDLHVVPTATSTRRPTGEAIWRTHPASAGEGTRPTSARGPRTDRARLRSTGAAGPAVGYGGPHAYRTAPYRAALTHGTTSARLPLLCEGLFSCPEHAETSHEERSQMSTTPPTRRQPPARRDDADAPPHRYTAALAAEIEARWQDRWDGERHVRGAQPGRARWPTPTPVAGAARSCSCWTCSRTRRARACTSATRWATSAPTSTPATSG